MTEPETRPSLLAKLRAAPPDEAAWAEFDGLYRQLVVRFARRHGLAPADAQDVAAQTMAGVATDIGRFEYEPGRCRFRSWLFGRARSRIIDFWRRSGTRQRALAEFETASGTPDPLLATWNLEWERFLVDAALARLGETRRLDPRIARVLHALYARGLAVADAAASLDLKPQDIYRIRSRWHDELTAAIAEIRRTLGE